MSWSKDATVRSNAEERGGSAAVPVVRVLHSPESIPGAADLATLIEGRQVVIGRDESADIQLKDGRVSRSHATLTHIAGVVHVVDSSANGTEVDGQRVERGPIGDGSIVRMGDSFLVVRWTSPDQADADVPSILGDAPAVQELRRSIGLIGPTETSVLVLGESGTGKELVARALHDASARSGGFVAVNCAAIPKELAESQLFGHVAGAFTGAQRAHVGYFRAADGGTLFLDEIGDLPIDLQPKLLRVLEERCVVPVGATKPIPVDIRLIAATHRDLAAGIDGGWFRGDLYSRVSDLVLATPPLRERREDILPLLRHALGDERPLDAELVDALLRDPWRFNVRELFKVGRELAVRAEGAPRYELRFVEARLSTPSRPQPKMAPNEAGDGPADLASRSTLPPNPAPSREELIQLLEDHAGNVSLVAKGANRSRKQIYRYFEEHGIDPAAFRSRKPKS